MRIIIAICIKTINLIINKSINIKTIINVIQRNLLDLGVTLLDLINSILGFEWPVCYASSLPGHKEVENGDIHQDSIVYTKRKGEGESEGPINKKAKIDSNPENYTEDSSQIQEDSNQTQEDYNRAQEDSNQTQGDQSEEDFSESSSDSNYDEDQQEGHFSGSEDNFNFNRREDSDSDSSNNSVNDFNSDSGSGSDSEEDPLTIEEEDNETLEDELAMVRRARDGDLEAQERVMNKFEEYFDEESGNQGNTQEGLSQVEDMLLYELNIVTDAIRDHNNAGGPSSAANPNNNTGNVDNNIGGPSNAANPNNITDNTRNNNGNNGGNNSNFRSIEELNIISINNISENNTSENIYDFEFIEDVILLLPGFSLIIVIVIYVCCLINLRK